MKLTKQQALLVVVSALYVVYLAYRYALHMVPSNIPLFNSWMEVVATIAFLIADIPAGYQAYSHFF